MGELKKDIELDLKLDLSLGGVYFKAPEEKQLFRESTMNIRFPIDETPKPTFVTRENPNAEVHHRAELEAYLLYAAESAAKRARVSSNAIEDPPLVELMKQMPSVTTTGTGPQGKTIEGFLYRYTKEKVSIVCLCHGKFLSPAAFVKHAGGGDAGNPMKLIKVLTDEG